MGIGACGDDLSTQFAVAFQNTDARIGLTHSFGQCGGVDLDALTHIDQTLQDLISTFLSTRLFKDTVSISDAIQFP